LAEAVECPSEEISTLLVPDELIGWVIQAAVDENDVDDLNSLGDVSLP
jgi:hypothetical protein